MGREDESYERLRFAEVQAPDVEWRNGEAWSSARSPHRAQTDHPLQRGESTGEPQIVPSSDRRVSSAFLSCDRPHVDERHGGPQTDTVSAAEFFVCPADSLEEIGKGTRRCRSSRRRYRSTLREEASALHAATLQNHGNAGCLIGTER